MYPLYPEASYSHTQQIDDDNTERRPRRRKRDVLIASPVGPSIGNNPRDVASVEHMLGVAGRLNPVRALAPSGRYDRELYDEVTAYQRERGLKADGLINPDGPTRNALRGDLAEITRAPRRHWYPLISGESFQSNGRLSDAVVRTNGHGPVSLYIADAVRQGRQGEAEIADLLVQVGRRDPDSALSLNRSLGERLSPDQHRRVFALAAAQRDEEDDDDEKDNDPAPDEPETPDTPDTPATPDKPEAPKDPEEPEEPGDKPKPPEKDPDQDPCESQRSAVDEVEEKLDAAKVELENVSEEMKYVEQQVVEIQNEIDSRRRTKDREDEDETPKEPLPDPIFNPRSIPGLLWMGGKYVLKPKVANRGENEWSIGQKEKELQSYKKKYAELAEKLPALRTNVGALEAELAEAKQALGVCEEEASSRK